MAETAARRALAVPELLSYIMEYLEDPPSTDDLYHACLVNRAFHSASVKPLHAYASSMAGNVYGRHYGWPDRKERMFREAIRRRSDIAQLVKSLHGYLESNAGPASRMDDILMVANLCPALNKLSMFTSDLNCLRELGAAIGGNIRYLELEWADIMTATSVQQLSETFEAFTVAQLSGGGVGKNDASDIDVTYSHLVNDDWLRLFASTPCLRRLKISVPGLVCLPMNFPVYLRDLQLHDFPGYLAAVLIDELANPSYLPHLRSLPDIEIYTHDEYLAASTDASIYSLEFARAVLDEEDSQSYLDDIPSMRAMKVSIEAALAGMETRKDWIRDERQITGFRALAEHWAFLPDGE